MPSRAHGPEPCASANFATRADLATLPQRDGSNGARPGASIGRVPLAAATPIDEFSEAR